MKEIVCKNCGAVFSEDLSKCPYCGTMNRPGAYQQFREKAAAFIDQVLGLQEEVEKSLSRMIMQAVLRALLLIAVISLAGILVSLTLNVNYYNDRKYDEEIYKDLIWENDNYANLESAYESDDLETINKLYGENSRVVSHWQHYNSYALKKAYKEIKESNNFEVYTMEKILYFLYYPQYYAYASYQGVRLNEQEQAIYEAQKQDVLQLMASQGYSEEELASLYESCKDSYGYLSYDALRSYLQEADHA